ncbi:MAG TPA: thiol peroxidase [Candidatus Dormibacteraeota bacterium]|nr:thiol peroxidase [Candidatus Dormibacteraeota bacterium]
MTTHVVTERPGAVTFKGEPKTLVGPELRVGDPLPQFTLVGADLQPVTPQRLSEGKRAALLIVVPSLDTGVCSLESKTFNARVGELPEGVTAYVVSRDLPFAQARWAKEQGDVRLQMLSDYLDHSFGRATGLEIKELGLLARAVIVVGSEGRVRYVQLVREVAQEPNYDEAIAAARSAV